jgi:hypothetical protein
VGTLGSWGVPLSKAQQSQENSLLLSLSRITCTEFG